MTRFEKRMGLVLLAGLGWVPAIRAAEPESLNLEQAIDYALRQNRDLALAAVALEHGELGIEGAKAQYAVRVRPDSSVGFSGNDDTWKQGLIAARKLPWGTDISTEAATTSAQPTDGEKSRRSIISVQVQQPLFRNFGRLVNDDAVVRANQQLRAAQRQYQETLAELVVNVVNTFETVIQLEGQIRSDEAFSRRMEQLWKLTRMRERQGRATHVDSLRVELQRGQSDSRLQASREQLDFNRRDFAELLGFEADRTWVMVPPPLLKYQVPSLTEAVRIALDNRMDYAQVIQDGDDSRRTLKIAQRGRYPDLSLVTTYQRFGDGADFGDSTSLSEDDWFVGFSADTEFNPAFERTAIGQAALDTRSAEQTIQLAQLAISRDVHQGMSRYQRAESNLGIAERNVKLSEDRAKLARRLFELGRGDSFTVTDAEDAYVQAENEVLTARAAASVSGYRLLQVLGTLVQSPDALKPKLSGTRNRWPSDLPIDPADTPPPPRTHNP